MRNIPFRRIVFRLAAVSACVAVAGEPTEHRPVAAFGTVTAPGHSVSSLCDGDPSTFARFADSTPGGRPATCSFTLDLGTPCRTTGLRLVSQPDRWINTMPFAFTVTACDAADATGGVRLATCTRLRPTVCGESQFANWPAVTARWYRVDVQDAGLPALDTWAMYHTWGDWLARDAWGRPHNTRDETPVTDIAEVALFDAPPDDLPVWNAHPAQAFPERRLRKDWLMQDFGWEGFARAAATNGPAYYAACRARRARRLARVAAECPRIVFVKHYTISGDAELTGNARVSVEERAGKPRTARDGGQLCLLEVHPDGTVSQEVLLDRPKGCIRDPDVSFDGKTILFSMRASFDKDDYHLHTLDVATRRLTQITFSDPAPCCDFEGVWTSEGKIVFQSTRCVQVIPCHTSEDSNLYTCEADGSNIRRLGYDGGSTLCPQELPDGRILYTRYEYNDRNARFQQPLFTMNPDGTGQAEYYGNGSLFPVSLIHFRPIPGTSRILGVVSGHHVGQKGKLATLDRARGTQGDDGLVFQAGADLEEKPGVVPSHYAHHPVLEKARRARKPQVDDFSCLHGPQWQYPYPLSETEWLTGFQPEGSICGTKSGDTPNFGIYWQNAAGERELLAWDPAIECGQPVPLRPRAKARAPRNLPRDCTQAFGVFHVQDVYAGPGLEGVARGTVKTLRVVALENRPAFFHAGSMYAPHDACFRPYIPYEGDISGSAVAVRGGAWDVKHVLGEVDVAADGSCTFEAPACNPVYFQLLDAEGRCVQTMRSWATLMPGEYQGCVGCHESKLEAPPPHRTGGRHGVQRLRPAPGQGGPHPLLARLDRNGPDPLGVNGVRSSDPDAPTEGFSFRRLVQPILDRHCVKCHDGSAADRPNLTGAPAKDRTLAFGTWKRHVDAHRRFTESYLALTARGHQRPLLNWYSSTGRSAMLPPRAMGSSASGIWRHLTPAHHGVETTPEEKRVFACWIDLAVPFGGSYAEATDWTPAERARFDYHQRRRALLSANGVK